MMKGAAKKYPAVQSRKRFLLTKGMEKFFTAMRTSILVIGAW